VLPHPDPTAPAGTAPITPAPPAPGGLYHAVAQATGTDPRALRSGVVTGAAPEHVAAFLLANPMRHGHFHRALVEPGNRSPQAGAEEVMATNARDLTGRLIATHLRVNLAVLAPNSPQPAVLAPFGVAAAQTVAVREVVVNGVVTYQPA
jgi:hypothetical protein